MTVLKFWFISQPMHIRIAVKNGVVQKCEIHEDTFYKWLNKKMAPPLAQKIISDVTGIETKEIYENVNFKINKLI